MLPVLSPGGWERGEHVYTACFSAAIGRDPAAVALPVTVTQGGWTGRREVEEGVRRRSVVLRHRSIQVLKRFVISCGRVMKG